jgi:hypothetical protein
MERPLWTFWSARQQHQQYNADNDWAARMPFFCTSSTPKYLLGDYQGTIDGGAPNNYTTVVNVRGRTIIDRRNNGDC